MSFSNFSFDINTPYFTATNNSNNMQYTNQQTLDSGIQYCTTTDCSFADQNAPTCMPTFNENCNNSILKVTSGPNYISKDDSSCQPVGDRITYLFTYSGEQTNYCGNINDSVMCQIGQYGNGKIDQSPAKQNYNWGLNGNDNINSGWINCGYIYNFNDFNNTKYINFQNWLSSILSIN
jgi:hypothetical protein